MRTPSLPKTALLLLIPLFLATAGCGDSSAPEGVGNDRQEAGARADGGGAGERGPGRVRPDRNDPPAGSGAMAPRLAAASGNGVWASWLEPVEDGDGQEAPVHRLRVARFDGEGWSEASTVATGTPEHPFFANWADTPSVVEGSGGELLAHWLAKTGDDTYAYAVFLARSGDGGTTWRELGTLHDDDTPTEHGFVSLLPDPGGGFRAFWLDGRAMVEDGPMALRTARVDEGVVEASTVLDPRVCECCQTSAALTTAGPLVVYRDRSPEEVRDVYGIRTGGDGGDGSGPDGWSEPASVHRDGWVIPGCPVNGPAVAAEGMRVVVAWFTAADGVPRVRAALSTDGGATFGPPVAIDGAQTETEGSGGGGGGAGTAAAPAPGQEGSGGEDGDGRTAAAGSGAVGGRKTGGAGAAPPAPPPLGRVDVERLADGTAVVSWLAGDGTVRLRRLAADGTPGPAIAVASTSTARASGFPRIQPLGDGHRLGVTWVEPQAEGGSRVRFATLPLAALPTAAGPDRRAATAGGDPRTGGADSATTPEAHAGARSAAAGPPLPEPSR